MENVSREDLIATLLEVLKGSTREMGRDGTGRPYAHIRMDTLEKVQAIYTRATGPTKARKRV